MTGIIQMFDWQHLLTGKRLNWHNHKRLPSGYTIVNGDRDEHDANSPLIILDKNIKKSLNGNCRVSLESSRASFSSSSCSSFSSLEDNKTIQQERPFSNRTFHLEGAMHNTSTPKSSNIDTKSIRSDFRDLVKDSLHGDARSLSVKTSTKVQIKKGNVLKYIDSPRPMHNAYMIRIDGDPRVSAGFNESIQVLERLKEAPSNFSEATEAPRLSYEVKDASMFRVSREAPRFSFDGREIRGSKLRELPRLSLDSRENSLRSSYFDSKANSISGDLDRSNTNQSVSKASKPSVVAKLMGLEAMPNLSSGYKESLKSNTSIVCDQINGQKNIIALQDGRQDQILCSPRSSLKSPNSRKLKDLCPVLKPNSDSKAPCEPVPLMKKQTGSVCSEIERRLEELEFQQSNKNLRALKQILGKMQSKGFLGIKKGDNQHSEQSYQENLNLKSANAQNPRITPIASESPIVIMKPTKATNSSSGPIVIMKPTKATNSSSGSSSPCSQLEGLSGLRRLRTGDPTNKRKGSTNSRMAKEGSPKATDKRVNNKSEEVNLQRNQPPLMQCSPRRQQLQREGIGSSAKASSSLSRRMQQRKLELEKKSHPPMTSSNSSKPKKPPNNAQPLEPILPRSKLRRKPNQAQQNDDRLSKISSKARNSGHQCDEISRRLDSTVSFSSQVDLEVRSADCSLGMNSPLYQQVRHKKSMLMLNEDVSTVELATISEQPSPISVLDASFYEDDMPLSPVKKISNALRGDETQASPDNYWNPMGLDDKPFSKLSCESNFNQLDSISILVQKLIQLSSTDNKPCIIGAQDQDQQFMSEILMVSGLLPRDLSSGAVHKTTPPSKPNNPEKFHQKLLFDVIIEILVQKLELLSHGPHPNLLFQARKVHRQHLLRELCSKIELLQAHGSRDGSPVNKSSILDEDVVHKSAEWDEFGSEQSEVVLEIERSIFKDLIDEVMSGEADSGLKAYTRDRRRRQLFAQCMN